MQISNQLVNTTQLSHEAPRRVLVYVSVLVFSLCFALVRAFCIFVVFRQFFFSFSIPFFSLFIKHTKDYRKYNSQIAIFISAWYFCILMSISVQQNVIKYCNNVRCLNKKEREKKRCAHWNRHLQLSVLIIKITISSPVIGLKMSYFPPIRLPSCYWIVCSWTVCYRTVY